MSVEDGVIQLEVILTERLDGLYTVNCRSNTVGPVSSGSQVALLIVDSKQLCITDYKPSNVSVGVEFQMELTIPAVVQNSSVLCYVQKKGQQISEVIQAEEVTTGRVKCRPYTAQRASRMEWGAAYTWDAAIDRESCPSPVELIAVAPPPVIQLAQFCDGLRKVCIEFDHNVDGSEKCSDIFAPETLALLGDGADCSYVANRLIVTLGSNPNIQGNSELQLLENSKVFREQSDLSLTAPASGKVTVIPPDPKTSTPQFEVEAPKLICPDAQLGSALGRSSVMLDASSTSTSTSPPQVIRILSSEGQKLEYNWSLDFSATPKDQRHNLMIWQSVRMFHTYLKKASGSLQSNQIPINTSMLMPGIEYKVSVSGVNMLGIQGETQQFSFQVMPHTKKSDSEVEIISSQLVVKGPAVTLSNAVSYIEATFVSCVPQIMKPNLNYQWKIEGELTQKVELPRGKRLCLHNGMLQGGKVYNISCTCTSESNESAGLINFIAWHAMVVLFQGIRARIIKHEMVLGTGQMLQLDASQSEDLDGTPGVLQFLWCCRRETGERCVLPRAGEPIPLESTFKDAFQQPVLTIPPGSLPVGRYIFTVEVSKSGMSSEAQATVVVVPGMPVVVSMPPGAQLKLVNPKEGVTVPAVVMNTREGCHMWWSVQQEPGYEYFNLAEVVGLGDTVHVTLEEAKDVMGREFPLVIPGPTGTWPGLKDNAEYKLRLSVVCPTEPVKSYTDFLITTNSPPTVKPLKVIPSEGEALRSVFLFSTDLADDSSADYPLLYKYGYQISDQEKVNVFSTSNVDLQAATILPSVTGLETVIFPVITVCDVHELCTIVTGEKVIVTLPSDLTLMEVQQIGVQFADYVASEQYPEALSIGHTSLQTLKQLPSQTLYMAGAEIIESEIQKDLKRKQNGLGANSGSLQSSLDFLDMSIRILSELPVSGSTLQDLSAFKDKILHLTKHSNELKLKYTSFPDRHLPSERLSRQRRSSGSTPPNAALSLSSVKSLLQVSERLIKTGNSSVVLEEKETLLQDLSTYMYHLCLGKEQKIAIGSSIVHFSVQKLLSKDQIMNTANFNIPDRTKFPPAINETGLIYLGQTVAEKYGPSGKTCLGGAVFPTDYLTDVAVGRNASEVKAQKRSSMVFEVQLVITERGLVPPGKLDHPLTFKIPVDNTTFQVDQVLQCATWNENMWSGDSCTTEKFVTLNSQMYMVCKCSILGYYTVLVTSGSTTRRVDATTAVTTTEMISTQKEILRASADPITENMHDSSAASILSDNTQKITCKNLSPSDRQDGVPISSEAYSISFRIEEDFNSTVGKQREQFKQKLRCEILAVDPQIPTRMIQGIDLSPGSIIVTVRLVDTDVKTAKEVIPAIARVIQNGDLNLHDLGNRKLNVPAQTVTIIEPYKPEKSNAVVYAVVGSVIVSTLGIISLVTGAVIIKRKKETEKMRMQQIPAVKDGIPSYRQFQFEQSIEGTEASLARYRSNYPTMGTAGTLVLGVNTGAIPGGRYELRVTDSKYMHPDISCNASQASEKQKKKKKKKKQQQGAKQAGSQNDPLNQEGIPPGDQDSGIVDGCTNVSEDRNMRKRNWDKKEGCYSSLSVVDRLWIWRPENHIQFLVGTRHFSLVHSIKSSCGINLCTGFWEPSFLEESSQHMKLISHLHPVSRLRIHGAILQHPCGWFTCGNTLAVFSISP
ncbi:uncharacterized protein LOC111873237 isoform X4 [Cryptotermes secundus]|nr:uncharacterized protein LOC111873237 isoform X4 [Cryptotermes secundus]